MDDGRWVDVSKFGDYDESFFGNGGLERLKQWVATSSNLTEVSKDVRLGAPLIRPSKIICIGLNFKKHIVENNKETPTEPILFFKATSAIAGASDDVVIPNTSKKTDWEVELAVVIGKKASYISEDQAMDHVAGYMILNDYSEREFQLEKGGQWVKGKSCDGFAPCGPFLATKDEIIDPHDLNMWLKVNDETKQEGNSSDMVFNIPQLISYTSQYMTLLPGDIISTGTPSGVGMGFKPPVYLKPGDVVELGIEGLGSSTQHLKAYKN